MRRNLDESLYCHWENYLKATSCFTLPEMLAISTGFLKSERRESERNAEIEGRVYLVMFAYQKHRERAVTLQCG